MLLKNGDLILTTRSLVQLQYWPRNSAGSGKKRNSGVELARCKKDVRELHTGLVQQVSVAAVSLDFRTTDVMEQTCESHTGFWSRPSCIKEGIAAQYFCSVKATLCNRRKMFLKICFFGLCLAQPC